MALLTKDTTLLLLRYPRSRSCSKSVSLTSTGFVTHPVPSLPSHFRFPLVLLDRKHSLHSTARADRNLLAKYEFDPSRSRIPGPSLDLLRGSNRPNLNPNSGSNDVFMTSATTPVSASIQEPVADTALQQQVENGGRKMTPLPAMIPISDEKEIRKTKAKDEEANKGKVARNKPITVQGVTVQVKPKPPGEEECCMSGCVNCVYTMYADDVLAYNESLSEAREALISADIPRISWPSEVRGSDRKVSSNSGEKSKDVKQRADEDVNEVLQDIDPSLKAFLEMERRMKAKSQQAGASS